MTRLLDYGLDRVSNLIMDMAELSVRSVDRSIELYAGAAGDKSQVFEWSEQLRVLQDEVTELAVELIARYQPVATDLRFIRSSIWYSFSAASLSLDLRAWTLRWIIFLAVPDISSTALLSQ